MSIARLCNDEIKLQKPDGRVIGPMRAQVSGGKAIVPDRQLDVAAGDTVLRRLPNGNTDEFLVDSAEFIEGPGGRLSHWTLVLMRPGAARGEPSTQAPSVTITNAYAVQVGDHNTQSIIATFESIIDSIDNSDFPAEGRREAKSRLLRFLEHPLVVAVLGGTAAGISSALRAD